MLEQNSIGYVFPDEVQKVVSPECQPQSNTQATDSHVTKSKSTEQDWQFVIPMPEPGAKGEDRSEMDVADMVEAIRHGFVPVNDEMPNGTASTEIAQANSGIFPAARARLASLRDLGAKKIGALKLKLIENKIKSNERGGCSRYIYVYIFLKRSSLNICITFIFRPKSKQCDAIRNDAHAKFCSGDFDHKDRPIFHRTIFTRHTLVECTAFVFGHAVRSLNGYQFDSIIFVQNTKRLHKRAAYAEHHVHNTKNPTRHK